MRRVVLLASALMLAGAGLVGAASAQVATPTAETTATLALGRTNVRYFLPLGGDGLNPELTVRAEESGACAHESLSSPGRPDAWNCVGDSSNAIYDPCFESPFSTPDAPGQLACVDAPFDTEVVLFTPTSPLPRFKEADAGPLPPQPIPTGDKPPPGVPAAATSMPTVYQDPAAVSEPLPWALELAGGDQCTLATGATAVFAGMRVNYFCSGGGSILGDPDRSRPVWAVTYLAEGAVASELVEVAVVWH